LRTFQERNYNITANQSKQLSDITMISGWVGVWGCSGRSLVAFRIGLGMLLTVELLLRFRFLHPFYSDQGTLPAHLLQNRVDSLYKTVCVLHCHPLLQSYQQAILSVQVLLAVGFTVGFGGNRFMTRLSAILSWYLYLSLTLRNPWMNYILDRYFHYLLFLSMFLPLTIQTGSDEAALDGGHHRTQQRTQNSKTGSTRDRGSNTRKESEQAAVTNVHYITPATFAIKLLVIWIYLDAGLGKYNDPLGGWSYGAQPLPALDTYARHTVPAQYLYALLQPRGLRILTPTVVYVELLSAPLALLGSYVGSARLVYTAIRLIVSLHVGIAITLRNAALLSFVACVAWCPFLPASTPTTNARNGGVKIIGFRKRDVIGFLLIGAMIAGSFWLETISNACDQSVRHIWSTLLHNRWNVFVGAEDYVTWEIAPGLLNDGSIVDVWGRRDTVVWSLPGGGSPCTATARPGRWRSFPYLAELEGEEGEALWRYLCDEWDRENDAATNPGRQLIKYNFFMLQADVLPEMQFSATRKRLIKTYECIPSSTGSADVIFASTEAIESVAIPESEPAKFVQPGAPAAANQPEIPMVTDGVKRAEPEFHSVEHNEPVPEDYAQDVTTSSTTPTTEESAVVTPESQPTKIEEPQGDSMAITTRNEPEVPMVSEDSANNGEPEFHPILHNEPVPEDEANAESFRSEL
jgi:hypothetical protein